MKKSKKLKLTEQQIEEITTSASSGSFSVPFQMIKREAATPLTEAQILKYFKARLVNEVTQGKSPAAKTTANSIKAAKTENNKANKASMEKVADLLKGIPVEPEYDDTELMSDEEIEGYSGGMTDIKYDAISKESAANQLDHLNSGVYKSEQNPNSVGNPKLGNNMSKAAKEREANRIETKLPQTASIGGDLEFTNAKKDNTLGKKLAFESNSIEEMLSSSYL